VNRGSCLLLFYSIALGTLDGCETKPHTAESSSGGAATDAGSSTGGSTVDRGGANDAGAPESGGAGQAGALGEAGAFSTPGAGGDDGAPFAPYPGLGNGGIARNVGHEFSVTARRLASAPDGYSWLLWESFESPDYTSRTPELDHFDANGKAIGRSPLADYDPNDFVLHSSGALTAWRGFCHDSSATCIYRDRAGAISEQIWQPEPRTIHTYLLDWDGGISGAIDVEIERRVLLSGAPAADGLYVLTNDGALRAQALDANGGVQWSVPLLPAVGAPTTINSPVEDILRALYLTDQSVARIVATDEGPLVAATVSRGTLAALSEASGVVLPLPDDPTCSDVLVARISADGQTLHYWTIPTPECESLPELTFVAGRAVVASSITVSSPPQPNDTSQIDISLSLLDLARGEAIHTTIAMNEDDIVDAMAACGDNAVCLAGMTGTRSVDTGSRVTYGDGFILQVSLDGTIGPRWTLHSERHTNIALATPAAAGSMLFFATVDGPITHTGDADPSLRYNRGLLGVVTPTLGQH